MLDYFWLIVAVSLAVVEGLTLGLTTIWFALGALTAWAFQLLNFSFTFQMIIFILVSGILLVLTRPLIKKYLHNSRVKTNADEVLGKEGIVIEDIDNINSKGLVKVKGQIWTSRSENNEKIRKNEIVKVLRIEGVKLIVKKS